MSLTYSDFPYYLTQETDLLLGALPREFKVMRESDPPLLQGYFGCQSVEGRDEDFIILAEFSELEGPIPLCTIPTDAPDRTDLDLNNLAVHLMSTDYQVNHVGQFKVCEDTQVVRKNVFKDVHVFMQYLTLYDLKARGFVRPFCFGYVSKDHKKLDANLPALIPHFHQMTRVLKHGNRKWFASELEQYLDKLRAAKDSFIEELSPKGDQDGIFSFEREEGSLHDPDAITLDQIAHQSSEIANILRTVREAECDGLDVELLRISSFLADHPDSKIVETLKGFGISMYPGRRVESVESLPLLHPLKTKGEALRPLTRLAQLGSVHLLWKLVGVYEEGRTDLLFSHMRTLTLDFQRDRETKGVPAGDALLLHPQLPAALQIIHAQSCPQALDNKSGSYHTVSEEESDDRGETESGGYVSAPGSVDSSPPWTEMPLVGPISLSSLSSEEDSALTSDLHESTEEVIQTRPWFYYASTKLTRGEAGYGVLNFFRHYHKVAHHVLYSILMGRPIIVCGSEEQRAKVGRIVTALVPFVPSFPSNSWKLLKWHQGILVPSHLKEYKLIGLCVPERLDFHDMINVRDQNYVTILDLPKKSIMGPAYSGHFLAGFEALCQKHFYNSDIAMLSYIGAILTDIQTKIYTYKSVQEKHGMQKRVSFKELGLHASDIQIVKYLGALLPSPDYATHIF